MFAAITLTGYLRELALLFFEAWVIISLYFIRDTWKAFCNGGFTGAFDHNVNMFREHWRKGFMIALILQVILIACSL